MAADDGARAGDRRHLDRRVAFRARPGPWEILGVDDGTLTGLRMPGRVSSAPGALRSSWAPRRRCPARRRSQAHLTR